MGICASVSRDGWASPPPQMVLYLEAFIPGVLESANSPKRAAGRAPRVEPEVEAMFAIVSLSGSDVQGGRIPRLPSGPIILEAQHYGEELRISFFNGVAPPGFEHGRGGSAAELLQEHANRGEIAAPLGKVAHFGAPLHNSLWLGLPAPGELSERADSVEKALQRARTLEAPKVKATLHMKSGNQEKGGVSGKVAAAALQNPGIDWDGSRGGMNFSQRNRDMTPEKHAACQPRSLRKMALMSPTKTSATSVPNNLHRWAEEQTAAARPVTVATPEVNIAAVDESAGHQPVSPLHASLMQGSSLLPCRHSGNDAPQALLSSLLQQLHDLGQEAQEAYLAHEMLEAAPPEMVEEQVEACVLAERERWKMERVDALKQELGYRRAETILEREHQQKLRQQRRKCHTEMQQERRTHAAVASKLKTEMSMLWNRLNAHSAREAAKDAQPAAKTGADSDGAKTARQALVPTQQLIGHNLLASENGPTIYRAPLGPLSTGTRCFRVLCFGDGLRLGSADALEDRFDSFGRALAASLSLARIACEVAICPKDVGTSAQDLKQLLETAGQQDLVLIVTKLGGDAADGEEHAVTDLRLLQLHAACHVCNTPTVALHLPRLPNQHHVLSANLTSCVEVTEGVAASFDSEAVMTSSDVMPPKDKIKEEDGLHFTMVGAQHLGHCLAPKLVPVLVTLPQLHQRQHMDATTADSDMVLPRGHEQCEHQNLVSCKGMEEPLQRLKAKWENELAEVEDELVRVRQRGLEVCEEERRRAESYDRCIKAVQSELAAEASQCQEGAKEGLCHEDPGSAQCVQVSHKHDSQVMTELKQRLLEASRQLQALVVDSRTLEAEKAELSCPAIAGMVTELVQRCEELSAVQHWGLQERPREVFAAAEVWQAPCMSLADTLREEICMERDKSVKVLSCHREETEQLLLEADRTWQRQLEGLEESLLLSSQEFLQAQVSDGVRGDCAKLGMEFALAKTAELEQEIQERGHMQNGADRRWASQASWQYRLEQAEMERREDAQQRLHETWSHCERAVVELYNMHEIELSERVTEFDIQLSEETEEVAQLRSQLQSVEAARCSELQENEALEEALREQLYISEEDAATASAMLEQQGQLLARIELNSEETSTAMLAWVERGWSSKLAGSAESTAAAHAALTLQTGLMNRAAQREQQLKSELHRKDHSNVKQIEKVSRMQARLADTTERLKIVNYELDQERESAQRVQADNEQFLYDLHEAHAAELNLATSVFMEAFAVPDVGECNEDMRHQLIDMLWKWQGQHSLEPLLGDMLP